MAFWLWKLALGVAGGFAAGANEMPEVLGGSTLMF